MSLGVLLNVLPIPPTDDILSCCCLFGDNYPIELLFDCIKPFNISTYALNAGIALEILATWERLSEAKPVFKAFDWLVNGTVICSIGTWLVVDLLCTLLLFRKSFASFLTNFLDWRGDSNFLVLLRAGSVDSLNVLTFLIGFSRFIDAPLFLYLDELDLVPTIISFWSFFLS